jgi:hypothetical protein
MIQYDVQYEAGFRIRNDITSLLRARNYARPNFATAARTSTGIVLYGTIHCTAVDFYLAHDYSPRNATMTFLIPALVAGASDVLILYLNASFKGTGELSGEEEQRKCRFG